MCGCTYWPTDKLYGCMYRPAGLGLGSPPPQTPTPFSSFPRLPMQPKHQRHGPYVPPHGLHHNHGHNFPVEPQSPPPLPRNDSKYFMFFFGYFATRHNKSSSCQAAEPAAWWDFYFSLSLFFPAVKKQYHSSNCHIKPLNLLLIEMSLFTFTRQQSGSCHILLDLWAFSQWRTPRAELSHTSHKVNPRHFNFNRWKD